MEPLYAWCERADAVRESALAEGRTVIKHAGITWWLLGLGHEAVWYELRKLSDPVPKIVNSGVLMMAFIHFVRSYMRWCEEWDSQEKA